MQKNSITGQTRLVGVIGWPVSHSFSPAMHNAALAVLGLNWVYVPLPVRPEDIETAIRGLPALGFQGVNVTVPHKQAVMPLLDEIEAGAQAIRAVNTIVVTRDTGGARLRGYNTDWSGIWTDLITQGVETAGRECLILGAGGSARAVVYALAAAGGRIQLLARRIEQAQQLTADLAPFCDAAQLRYGPLSDLPRVVAKSHAPLIINTTPLGMTPHTDTSPWPDNLAFPRGAFVYDLVYNPLETRFMKQARAAGCPTTNGLGMLIHQGAQAFQLWTGQKPDTAVMRDALQLS